MPAPKTFSHTVRQEKQRQDGAGEKKWEIDLVAMGFIFVAFMSALMTFTMYQNDTAQTNNVNVAVYQSIMLFGGLMIGFVVSMTSKGLGMTFGAATWENMSRFFKYVFIMSIALIVINRMLVSVVSQMSVLEIISGLPDVEMASFSMMTNAVLTAAIVEEAIFAFAFGIFFYKFCSYIIKGIFGDGFIQDNMASLIAAVIVGFFFFAIHIGRYGYDPTIGTVLAVNRIIYNLIFYRTRDFKIPMALHLVNNLMSVL